MTDARKTHHLLDRGLMLSAISLALATAALLILWTPQAPPPHPALPMMQLPEGGDFALQGIGGELTLASLRGKAVLLYFAAGKCEELCSDALTTMAAAIRLLPAADRAHLESVYIALDPAGESLSDIEARARMHHPELRGGLIAAEKQSELARRYGSVEHSSLFYLLDQRGQLSTVLPHGIDATDLAQAARQVLATHQG